MMNLLIFKSKKYLLGVANGEGIEHTGELQSSKKRKMEESDSRRA
jgi:hypothetical protein